MRRGSSGGAATMRVGRRRLAAGRGAPGPVERGREQGEDRRRIHVADHDRDHVRRVVGRAPEVEDPFAGARQQVLVAAADRMAVGAVVEREFQAPAPGDAEAERDVVVHVVLVHEHLALGVERGRIEDRVPQRVAQDVDGHGQLRRRHGDVVVRRLVAGARRWWSRRPPPPRSAKSLSPRRAVPLNSMCSMPCDQPRRASGSRLEPTPTQTLQTATGRARVAADDHAQAAGQAAGVQVGGQGAGLQSGGGEIVVAHGVLSRSAARRRGCSIIGSPRPEVHP